MRYSPSKPTLTVTATLTLSLVITGLLAGPRQSSADWKSMLDQAQKTVTSMPSQTPADLAVTSLSNTEVVDGLKQALVQGSKTAIDSLGREDGFLGNPDVRIPLPGKLGSLEKGLRVMGQGAAVDGFITSMNRAAEQAVPQATDLFVNTITSMSLEDAQNILKGPNDAATQYLRQHGGDKLTELMKPIVKDATDKVGVTSAYKNMIGNAGMLGQSAGMNGLDLDNYVTEQATNGLFLLIAAEEKRIRENPLARTTDILKKVFSSAM